LRTPWQRLAEHFGLRVTDLPELFEPRFNVAPTQQILIVREDAAGQRRAAA
jgi:putative SOS response-associated peptidase YedK